MTKGYHSGVLDATKVSTTNYEGPAIVTIGLGGTVAAGFPFDTVTRTEATAAYCKVYDASATSQYNNLATSATGTGYSSNYQIFPDTEAINDAIYFGNSSKFGAIYVDVDTVGTYSADAAVWEYYDGDGWATFTPRDNTDTTAYNGKRPFQADGYIIMSVGNDWTETTIDSQVAFWVRCRLTAATMTQAAITNSVEHAITTLNYGSRVATEGRINRLVFRWGTNSGANNDTKFYLINMNKGTSANLTHTKEKQNFAVSLTTPLDVSKSDKLALFFYQIDGATEFANGTMEVEILKRV